MASISSSATTSLSARATSQLFLIIITDIYETCQSLKPQDTHESHTSNVLSASNHASVVDQSGDCQHAYKLEEFSTAPKSLDVDLLSLDLACQGLDVGLGGHVGLDREGIPTSAGCSRFLVCRDAFLLDFTKPVGPSSDQDDVCTASGEQNGCRGANADDAPVIRAAGYQCCNPKICSFDTHLSSPQDFSRQFQNQVKTAYRHLPGGDSEEGHVGNDEWKLIEDEICE